jgi:single-strand DNA-binding protein
MATNEAHFDVTGYVATQPKKGETKSGTKTLTFRIGWTPREVSRQTGEWADLPSSFVSVTCYRKIAENAARSLRKGDPVVLKGTLRVREYADQAGTRRNSVDVTADFLGHDLARGTSDFSKQSRRAQQTAEEYAQSQAGGGERLPDDVAAEQRLDVLQPESAESGASGLALGADAVPEDLDDLIRGGLADPDSDDDADVGEPGSDDDADSGEPVSDGDTDRGAQASDPDKLAEVGDSEPAKPRGRYRKAEPVGARA